MQVISTLGSVLTAFKNMLYFTILRKLVLIFC